jgi:hypothetical protein
MMKKIIYFLLISFFVAGCNVKDIEHDLENVQHQEKNETVSVQQIIYTKDSQYAKFFDSNVDSEIAYGSSREHPLYLRDFNAYAKKIKIIDNEEPKLKANSTAENTLTVRINGKSIEQLNSSTTDNGSQNIK